MFQEIRALNVDIIRWVYHGSWYATTEENIVLSLSDVFFFEIFYRTIMSSPVFRRATGKEVRSINNNYVRYYIIITYLPT